MKKWKPTPKSLRPLTSAKAPEGQKPPVGIVRKSIPKIVKKK